MDDARDHLRIGEFAKLVGLSIPQLRRYDRLRLLEPAGRSASSGYRFYHHGQTGTARIIALLRSIDMPIAEIRRIVSGADEPERQRIFRDHRARLEARLTEVRHLLDTVDALTAKENEMPTTPGTQPTKTQLSEWLHVMPHLPVRDLDRSIAYYQEALGFQLSWRTADGSLAAMASREIETLLLVPWREEPAPPPHTAYVYVEDPDSLCAEYQQAGADVVDPVASRASGMRDFVVRDLDGHQFRIGRGEEALRDVADHYGMTPDEIAVDPSWLERRKSNS